METYHVIPSAGIFTLTKNGSNAPLGEFFSRSQALTACTTITGGHEATLKIHRHDGSIVRRCDLPRPERTSSSVITL
jgi:hypothetical protein